MDITELLAFSVQQGASDLHLSAGLPAMIRVDDDIRRLDVPIQDHARVQALVYDIMNDRQRKDFEEHLETIRLALTAAETGHLVFGTLHTTSAAKTIDRIVDVFPAAEKAMVRSMLSESLQAVISQTLLKRKTGGRVAAHEIMRGTAAIRNLIREDKVAQMYSAIQTGQSIGMQTMDQSLQGLVQKRVISLETAREKARQPEAMVA